MEAALVSEDDMEFIATAIHRIAVVIILVVIVFVLADIRDLLEAMAK
jgi:succinate dehydrogenase/fumarate reductase cytochrome b subunit